MGIKHIAVAYRTIPPVLLLFLVLWLRFFMGGAVAQETRHIIWVFDQGTRDSQFGYYDGERVQATEPVYFDADIEGLSCLNDIIYASGGLDTRAPSTLNTLVIDTAANTAALSKIADILTAGGDPFFEVVSLSADDDGVLWGYADGPPLRGIIRLNPANGVAELVAPFDRKVEAITWIGDILWLAGDNNVYQWTPGGTITRAFEVAGVGQIEALEAIDGLLYAGIHEDERGVIAIDPDSGEIVQGVGIPAPDDIEGLTFCPLAPEIIPTPTPTLTATAIGTPPPTATSAPPGTATPTATGAATATPTQVSSPAATLGTATPTATATPTGDEPGAPTPTTTATATATVLPTATLAPPTDLEETEEPGAPGGIRVYLPLVSN